MWYDLENTLHHSQWECPLPFMPIKTWNNPRYTLHVLHYIQEWSEVKWSRSVVSDSLQHTRIVALNWKPHFWQLKKKVQGEREFLRGLLASIYAKISGYSKSKKRRRKLHRKDDMGLGVRRMTQGKSKRRTFSTEVSTRNPHTSWGGPPWLSLWLQPKVQEEMWLEGILGREAGVTLWTLSSSVFLRDVKPLRVFCWIMTIICQMLSVCQASNTMKCYSPPLKTSLYSVHCSHFTGEEVEAEAGEITFAGSNSR